MIDRTEQEITQKWKGDSTTPLLSICTVTYNHEKFIAEALDSFLMQETDFPFEIVVDEDCSTDGTAVIISRYVEKFPTIIKANLREENIGMMPNFTENIKRSRGKYIALCEGDDYWTDKGKLQYQIEKMQEYNKCEISFHPTKLINDQTITDKLLSKHEDHDKIFTIQEIIKGDGGFCPTASIIIKKDVINNLPNFFTDAPVGDYFIQIFGSINGGALYIDKSMSAYRIHSGGVWTSMGSNFSSRKKFSFEMLHSLEEMDRFFNFKYNKEIAFMTSQVFVPILRNKNFSIRNRVDLYKTCRHNIIDEQQTKWLEDLVENYEQQKETINTKNKIIEDKDNLIQEIQQNINQIKIKEKTILDAIQHMVQYPFKKYPIKKYKAYKNMLKIYHKHKS